MIPDAYPKRPGSSSFAPSPCPLPRRGRGQGEGLGLAHDFDGDCFGVTEDDVVTHLDLGEPLDPRIDLDGPRITFGSLEGNQPLLVVDLLDLGADLHGVHGHGLGLLPARGDADRLHLSRVWWCACLADEEGDRV